MSSEKVHLSRLIVICGVDGCGKTTLARYLSNVLQEWGIENQVVWSRFRNYLSKPLLALTRVTGHNRKFFADGEWLAHHDFSRLTGYRELYVLLQALDVNIGAYWYITRVRRCFSEGVVICERGPWDTWVDVLADTRLDTWLFSKIGDWYVRQVKDADVVIHVDRELENIFKSRPALRYDPTIRQRHEFYRKLAVHNGWHVLDNNFSLECSKRYLKDLIYSIGWIW